MTVFMTYKKPKAIHLFNLFSENGENGENYCFFF